MESKQLKNSIHNAFEIQIPDEFNNLSQNLENLIIVLSKLLRAETLDENDIGWLLK